MSRTAGIPRSLHIQIVAERSGNGAGPLPRDYRLAVGDTGEVDRVPESNDLNVNQIAESIRAVFERPESGQAAGAGKADGLAESGEVDGVPESNGLNLKQIAASIRAGFERPESSRAFGAGKAQGLAESGEVQGVPESNDLNLKQIAESIRAAFERPESARFPHGPTRYEAAFGPEATP